MGRGEPKAIVGNDPSRSDPSSIMKKQKKKGEKKEEELKRGGRMIGE